MFCEFVTHESCVPGISSRAGRPFVRTSSAGVSETKTFGTTSIVLPGTFFVTRSHAPPFGSFLRAFGSFVVAVHGPFFRSAAWIHPSR